MTAPADLCAALPGYEIGEELGRGGFGVVLSGHHRQLGRPVAIKQLPPQLATDPKVRARFVTEARVLASLDHPHIVPIYDYVEQEGLCLLVMESLPGGTVWDSFVAHGFSPQTACGVVMVACAGLHCAHAAGVLHRDVKPENLLFAAGGQVKVSDFGIARVIGGSDALATTAGEILGTPAYMAPEQAQGVEVGPQADVYAAGVMLYELLSGRLPFSEEGGGIAIVYRHVYEKPVPLLEVAPTLPPRLAEVVMQALERDPADRHPGAEAFGVALGEAATTEFGAGWLKAANVPVVSAGPILASTERLSGPVAPAARTSRETIVGLASTLATAGAPAADGAPVPSAPATRAPATLGAPTGGAPGGPASNGVPGTAPLVRPSTALHVQGSLPTDAGALVPVRQVLDTPPWPVPFAVVTAVLAGVVALVAVLGLGVERSESGLAPGSVQVAGADLAGRRPVTLDLTEKVPLLAQTLPAAARRATEVSLHLSVAGVPLVPGTRVPITRVDRSHVGAQLDARADRYLAAGLLSAELVFSRGEAELATVPFTARSATPAWTTVPGVLAAVALLVLLAYGESLLAPLRRRGRRRLPSIVGLIVVGAALGAWAVVAVWVVGLQPLSRTTLAPSAAVGALFGLALANTALRVGRRARLRRIARQHEVRREQQTLLAA